MYSQSILATTTLALFTSISSAIIIGFAIPQTIAPGDIFAITIETADYIQSVTDVAMAFGAAPSISAGPDELGGFLFGSTYLGPMESNILTNITYTATAPSTLPLGTAVVTGSLFSLLGADNGPSITDFTADVTIGSTTSTDLVQSVQATS